MPQVGAFHLTIFNIMLLKDIQQLVTSISQVATVKVPPTLRMLNG